MRPGEPRHRRPGSKEPEHLFAPAGSLPRDLAWCDEIRAELPEPHVAATRLQYDARLLAILCRPPPQEDPGPEPPPPPQQETAPEQLEDGPASPLPSPRPTGAQTVRRLGRAPPLPLPPECTSDLLDKLTSDLPAQLLCPITCAPLLDPVDTSDGHTYERYAITQWLDEHETSPLTGLTLSTKRLRPNLDVRHQAEVALQCALGDLSPWKA